jgi:hypothetical protein
MIAVYDYRLRGSNASCECGWAGQRRYLKALATQDAWTHFIDMRCELSVPLIISHPL